MKKANLIVCCLVFALVLQMTAVTVFAQEVDMSGFVVEDGGATGAQVFDVSGLEISFDGIEKELIPASGTRTRSPNTPPIADLGYIVLNPTSLKNGDFTSDTMIAWLWSYNGVDYSYDPDGDTITNVNIGGIPSSAIIGYLNGDIGFVTQFSTPAQYVMTFQVQDEYGAVSNTLELVLDIEPSGANTRPIGTAIFEPSSGTLTTAQQASISWGNFSDADAGDYISDIRGVVYNDTGTHLDITDYVDDEGSVANPITTLEFGVPGFYEVWFSVSDSNGAWSDWSIFTYNVTAPPVIQLAQINYSQLTGGDAVPHSYWFNQEHAIEQAMYPTDYLALFGQSAYPLSSTAYVGGHWSVSGQFVYGNGSPVADEDVTIAITNGFPFARTVTTNANGTFSMDVTLSQYFMGFGTYGSSPLNGFLTGATHYSGQGTSSYVNATLEITCDETTYSYSVAQLVGVSAVPIVGDYYYDFSLGLWIVF